MTEIQPFDVGDQPWRFGTADDGRPFVVAADVAGTFEYRDAANALRLLDDDEKGTQIVSTPGGDQRLSVVYEDGIWELIFRSTKPEARAIKKQVKEILRTIRETGGYGRQVEAPATYSEALRALADQHEATEAAQQRAAELEPAAHAWDTLADAEGDYSLREAAQVLDRDPAISTGQKRLARSLREFGWTASDGQPYQRHVDTGRLVRRTVTYPHPRTGVDQTTTQPRITAKGLRELHELLRGGGQLQLIDGGAA